MIRRAASSSQVSERVAGNRLLSQIHEVETECLEQIVNLALHCESIDKRWHDYERLKSMANNLVGWNANHPELRTNAHYEVVLAFIDWLLPEDEEP